jgi:hypothetical protein
MHFSTTEGGKADNAFIAFQIGQLISQKNTREQKSYFRLPRVNAGSVNHLYE